MKSKVDYYNVKIIETPTSIEVWEYLDKPVIHTVKTEKEKKKELDIQEYKEEKKYKDELLDRVNDKRRTRDSIARRIAEIYDNIYSLSEQVILKDIFTDTLVADGITIPGPDKEYSLDAVAKRIDSRESDDIDKETIVNAVSTQLSIAFGLGKRLLLTGDSSFAAIENSVKSHSAIQLPHHGKLDQAEQIFGCKDNSTIYFVSDNTGATNGGSTKLKAAHPRGHAIFYTLDGDQTCTSSSFRITQPTRSYFRGI